ncbi:polyketide synthase PksD [Nemania sp. FL0916]|nr:polyketide synthase PksD [Nemania sp. FL0916]
MDPIAIIGFSFKLPQGNEDETSFWETLVSGRTTMTAWPESRMNIGAYYDADKLKENRLRSKGANFLREDVAVFDGPFFSMTSNEAASMDPQQRWLLETSYRALENSGIRAEDAAGTDTAVFAASMTNDYLKLISKDPEEGPQNTATGTSAAMLANRLSWYFDFNGPSVQVNTACSSGLVTVDLACQSLRNKQCSMALVTGSNMLLSAEESLHLSSMNMLSPDSLCYSFDHRANGYARGEGVVVLVMKTLQDAIKDGNMIRAVIRATSSNQDGRTPGITQPSIISQEKLIRQTYKSCSLELASTHYVEAHGTGTQIGDSTEIKALGRVFNRSHSSTAPLYVGSVKANIGHLEGCSGLASIIKCIMVLERGTIPMNPLFEKWNAKINHKANNIQVPTSNVQWPTQGLRRISINSFGFGGTNGHVIMDDVYHTLESLGVCGFHCSVGVTSAICQEIPDTTAELVNMNGISQGEIQDEGSGPAQSSNASTSFINGHSFVESKVVTPGALSNGHCQSALYHPNKAQLLVWSARDESALKRLLLKYIEYYTANVCGDSEKLNQLAFTLASKRSVMQWRSFAVTDADGGSAIEIPFSDYFRSTNNAGLALVFTGQGVSYSKAVLDLLQYPVFHDTLIQADKEFARLGASWSLFDELDRGDRLEDPQLSQPICTALQIALVELVRSFNAIPKAVIGHSSGEIAAAYTIGALSLESACKVAYHRGRLAASLATATLKPSAMMSVALSESEAYAYLEKHSLSLEIHIACVNSPTNVTLSGNEAALDTLKAILESASIFARKLKTGVAYHSPAMRSISADYLSSLDDLTGGPSNGSNIVMVSTVTGDRVSPSTLSNGRYWVNNLVSPVRFTDAIQYLMMSAPKADGLTVSDLVEIGPYDALRRPVTDTLRHIIGSKAPRYSSLLSRAESTVRSILGVAGRLFALGYPISVNTANQFDASSTTPFLVDTPEYPFDHSRRYWFESRLSRDWRLRGAVSGTLLGSRVADWNPLEPKWRKFLSIEEMPWLADHVVGGSVLFPATGMVLMALEAAKQAAADKSISEYLIKDATFISPIVIQPEEKTEVTIHLRTLQQGYEKVSQRFEVTAFTYKDASWRQCLKAVVQLKYDESTDNEIDNGLGHRSMAHRLIREAEQIKTQCLKPVSRHDFYQWLQDHQLRYGPTFSLVDDICWNGNNFSIARITPPSCTSPFQGVITHPAVLDACCQVCFAAPSDGTSASLPTTVPHKLENVWISATGWQTAQEIQVFANSHRKRILPGVEGSFIVLAEDGSPLCHFKRIELLPISGQERENDEGGELCHFIDWQPDLSLLDGRQLQDYCRAVSVDIDESTAVAYCTELETTMLAVLQHNMQQLRETDWLTAPPHMKKYVTWVERQLHEKGHGQDIDNEEMEAKLDALEKLRPSWRMLTQIARDIVSIVHDQTDAIELLFATNLAQDFYDEFFRPTYNSQLKAYLQLAAHKTPTLKVLEVGAGTGGLTNYILSTFQEIESSTGGIAFSEYTYTDVSPAFFEKAQDRFSEHKSRMVFRTLDLDQDIGAQGFRSGTYDIVVAGSVLHATRNIAATIRNLHAVLKPGGHLLFHETTAADPFVMGYAFGILPGWWCSEEESRFWGPTITDAEWDAVLQENGYSGNDLVIRDYRDDVAHYASIICSTAREPVQESEAMKTIIVVNDDNEHQMGVAIHLASELVLAGRPEPAIQSLTQFRGTDMAAAHSTIVLADIGQSLLAEMTEDTFTELKIMIQRSDNLLWVTFSEISEDWNTTLYPYSGLKDGLLRTLRQEFGNKQITTLSIEDNIHDIIHSVKVIAKIFSNILTETCSGVEYIVRDGRILTGRLSQAVDLNNDLNSAINASLRTEPLAAGPALKLDIGVRGFLETLHFTEDHDHGIPLGPLEVEIEAQAWSINFRDVFGALGRIEEAEGFGSDCAGIVTRVGSECSHIRPGDRVCMWVIPCMKTYPRAEKWAVFKVPDHMTSEEACAVLNPGVTAWYSLGEVARLRRGEKVLIHSAAGATGQVAIQIAQMLGAEIFATVGHKYKKDLLMDLYNMPEDHIFYSRDTSFAESIMVATDDYGVDVVLNSLVGEGLRASWECIAPYGRFIELGKADINANAGLSMAPFAKNVTFSAVNVAFRGRERVLGEEVLTKVMALVAAGDIQCPKPLHIYDVSAVEEAFRYVQSGKNTGRTIIKIDPSSKVQKRILDRRNWIFDKDATYVVAGGFGGIGRSILKWMASKGAKHLMVLSRSGPISSAAVDLVSGLTKQGITVIAPKCDVSSVDSLSDAIQQYGASLPPIRGVINATMTLNDSVFDNMSHEQWQQTIRSKVQTSWNLHTLFPSLDFFILLSSISGVIGNAGQSNYAAGCTFQDSLARYRSCHNQKSLSIDLGVMRDVGILAETNDTRKNSRHPWGVIQVREVELLTALDIYCDPELGCLPPDRSRVTMGLTTPLDLAERGLEPEAMLQWPLFARFSQARTTSDSGSLANVMNFTLLFQQAESREARIQVVVESLAKKLARALSIEPGDVDAEKPLHVFGVDSLVAVELRNWISKEFAADLSVLELMGGSSIAAIGALVTKASKLN